MIRVLVGLGVLVVCGASLVALETPEAHLTPRAVAQPAFQSDTVSSAERDPGQWFVRVDGWSMQFDGVERAQPPAAVNSPAAQPPVTTAKAAEFTSPYDTLIAKHAAPAGLDWRLVSALIFEESGFEPTLESEDGAYGLMQVRPIAAREVGATAFRKPDANIRTGVQYLKRLAELFSGVTERDRMALLLAAYNMGPGHLQDAQMLATRFGYDPLRWDGSMEKILPLLERPAIYAKLPNGFAQGQRTAAYVDRVLSRFARLRGVLAPAPIASASEVVGRPQAASASG